MPERRPVFGAEFIYETVVLFERLSKQPFAGSDELKWASDVLTQYFEIVEPVPGPIAEARQVWESIQSTGHTRRCDSNTTFAPYKVRELENVFEFDQFLTLCTARRSQRWFLPKPVPRENIELAVMAALQAPSACNRQPFTFHCATAPEMIRKITNLPLGTKGFGDNLPAVIAVIGDLSMYAEPRDRHLIYIDSSLAAMQFMLAITAQGLGSVPMNWPDIPKNHQALRELLDLQQHQVPIMLIGVGIPDPESSVAYSAKRSVEEVLRVID